MTIFITLILGISISLVLTMVEGARISTIRMETACAGDIALQSVLAEYHRELWSQYDLFFIDTSYGGEQPDIHNTEERIRCYMNENFRVQNSLVLNPMEKVRDFLALKAEQVQLEEIYTATDLNGKILRRQATEYMKQKYGLDMLESVTESTQELDADWMRENLAEEKRNQVKQQIDAIELPKRQREDGSWEEVPLDNPADHVTEIRDKCFYGGAILAYVLGNNVTLSTESVTLAEYFSYRKKLNGNGMNPELNWEESIGDKFLFQKYLMEKTGSYRAGKENSRLKYQKEYLLNGEASDLENLKKTAVKLVRFREVVNVAYIFTDKGKCSEARTVAAILTAIMLKPEFLEPVTDSILLAWAYMESLQDVRCLMQGGKVPIAKTAETWKTGLLGSLLGSSLRDENGSSVRGLTYDEYLEIFLLKMNLDLKTRRFIDLIEMDIRKTMGNQWFKMDGCIEGLKAMIQVSSQYGYHYQMERIYGYQ
ncbi:MAG: DUF5702 domain-containing protein [Lachnospiraceae bacterium]|nr:DUF5702 domain-containing protein [Lachnospiraceae bacterium]